MKSTVCLKCVCVFLFISVSVSVYSPHPDHFLEVAWLCGELRKNPVFYVVVHGMRLCIDMLRQVSFRWDMFGQVSFWRDTFSRENLNCPPETRPAEWSGGDL